MWFNTVDCAVLDYFSFPQFAHDSPGAACLCCFFASRLDTQMLLLFSGFSVDLDVCSKGRMLFWRLYRPEASSLGKKTNIHSEQWNIFTHSHPLKPCQPLCSSLSSCLSSTASSWSFRSRLLFPSRDSFPLLSGTWRERRCETVHERGENEASRLQLNAQSVTSELFLSLLSTKRPSLLSFVQFNCTTRGLSSRSTLRSYSTVKTEENGQHIHKSVTNPPTVTLLCWLITWLFGRRRSQVQNLHDRFTWSLLSTFIAVDLIQGVTRGQHLHVRPELLWEGFDQLVSRRVAANAQALCGHVPSDVILKVEAHHAVKLQVLFVKTENCWNLAFKKEVFDCSVSSLLYVETDKRGKRGRMESGKADVFISRAIFTIITATPNTYKTNTCKTIGPQQKELIQTDYCGREG